MAEPDRPAHDPASTAELMAAAARARAAHDYATAADLYSRALAWPTLPPEVEYDLLKERAECHSRQGLFEALAVDADAMLRLAEDLDDPARRVHAWLRQVQAGYQLGRASEILALAERALAQADQLADPRLRAASLVTLAFAQRGVGDLAGFEATARGGLDLLREVGDHEGEAKLLTGLAFQASQLGKSKRAIDLGQQALKRARQVSSAWVEAQALNVLGSSTPDLSRKRDYYEQSLALFEATGDLERQNALRNNLAIGYVQLGLYQKARQYAQGAVELARARRAGRGLVIFLETLGRAYATEPARAEAVFREGLALTEGLDSRELSGYFHLALGQLAVETGQIEAAHAHLRAAAVDLEAAKLAPIRTTTLAWQGLADLRAGHWEQAHRSTSEAASRLEAKGASADLRPQDVYWLHYQVLRAAPQPDELADEASRVLDQARTAMLAGIATLTDAGLRRNYFTKVKVNHDILTEWARRNPRRAKGAAPRQRGGKLEEQFKRLIEIGVRMSALADPAALPDFIAGELEELTGAERVYLIGVEDGARRVLAARGPEADLPAEAQPMLDAAAAARRPVLRHDVPAEAEPGDPAGLRRRSALAVPLISRGALAGFFYTDQRLVFGRYTEAEADLAGALANQAATALENAQLVQGLERRVAARTAELEQRAGELAIINSVQAGLAAQLDFQGVIDLVGDKLREVLHTGDIGIRLYDAATGRVHLPYEYEHGQRLTIPDQTLEDSPLVRRVLETRRPLVLNWSDQALVAALGIRLVPGTDQGKCLLTVPILTRGDVTGLIVVENYEREDAFSEADVRLLSTLAGSLGVALENARLFAETRRLLEETEQRAAELAVINSVQQGLASKLDFQGVIELVGEKVREIFGGSDMSIRLYDRPTNQVSLPFFVERGRRLEIAPVPLLSSHASHYILENRQPLLILSNEDALRYGFPVEQAVLPGTEQSQAFLGVPIIIGDEAIGLITLESFATDAFDAADQRLLSTLASSLGVALENARLFAETKRLLEETEQRAAELAVINSVQQGLAAQLDFQGIVELVGDKLREVLRTDSLAIRLYDPATELLHYPYEFERGRRLELEARPGAGSPVLQRLLATNAPLLGNTRAEQEALGLVTMPGTENTLSFLAVPILTRGQTTGCVMVADYEQEQAFSDADVRLVSTLANSLGVALENARLFAETKRLLMETEQRNAELAVINSVQQGLVAQLDYQGIIDLVGDKLREVLHTGDLGIRVYDQITNLVHYVYEYEHGRRLYPDPAPLREGSLGHRLLTTGQPLLVNSGVAELVAQDLVRILPGTDMEKSLLAVPILARGLATGLILLPNYERENAFSEADVRLLSTLAASMGVALENARLFAETKRLLEETTQRNAELAVINSVQQGLVAKLDTQAIYDLVGDKIRDIFGAQSVLMMTFDHAARSRAFPYMWEKGQRFTLPAVPLNKLAEYLIENKQPLMLNARDVDRFVQLGMGVTPGTQSMQSGVFVPLIVDGTVTGCISLQNVDREDAFSEADVRLLLTLSSSMSVALENARLFAETQRLLEETEQRNAELAVINSVQQGLVAEVDSERIIDLVGGKLREVLRTGDIGIRLFDRAANRVHYVYQYEHGQRLHPAPATLGGLSGHVVGTGQPLIINEDVPGRFAEIGARLLPGTDMPLSLAAVPLPGREGVRGLIVAENYEREQAFSEADTRLLATVASGLSVALENARLFEEARRRASEMAALTEIGREISASLDLGTVLYRIASRAREVLRARDVVVRLLEPDGSLPVVAAEGRYADAYRASALRLGEGITGAVAQTGQAEFVNDPLSDPRVTNVPGTEEDEEHEAILFAPLKLADKVVGVMVLWRDKPVSGPFSQADLDFAVGLARQAAIAIENARLFAEVERQRQYSEAVLNTSPVAIITTDLDDRVVSWNPGAERLFGYAAAEAAGRHLDDLIAGDPELRAEAERFNTSASQGRLDAIARRQRKDGTLVDVELAGVPVRVDDRLVGFIAIYHDITALLQARREAESANQAKSAFLATMSHEIRTPMNAVLGMSGLLLDTPLTAEQREFAEIIRGSGDALLNIINDILDFSKIEAGKMELENQPFDLREVVESALDLVANRAFDKGLDLAYELDERLPPAFSGDAGRLRQVLLNLLSNAVKFTERGEVVLAIRPGGAAPAANGRYQLHFTVRDTGTGIPLERMDRLFQSFSQVDASTARKYGGTGLGLAISRRLVELMGGQMTASSEGIPGRGTTFVFTLLAEPLAQPVVARRDLSRSQPLLANKRVLIVDDNDTNRRILTAQTRKWGLQTRDTADPREALAWIQRGDAFDLAILDMHMPEMDGVALGAALRQHRDAQALPLVLFTSLGRREAGAGAQVFAAHLTKPIKPSALYDALVGVFAGQAAGAEQATQPGAAPGTPPQSKPAPAEHNPLRLLLAEDNAVNQKLALRLLQQMGYRADVAGNGLEAVTAVERQPYDVILMDVQMPEMDGLEATRQIVRRWPNPAVRPRIIAMTANAMPGDREMCLAAGMDDYLTKPIRVEALANALRHSRQRVEQGTPPVNAEPLLDERTLQELVAATDADFVRELIETYLDDSPRLIDDMRSALAAGDTDTLRRAAHSLKGNSASVGALGLSELAKAVELSAKAGQLDGTAPRLDQIVRLYAEVAAALKDWQRA